MSFVLFIFSIQNCFSIPSASRIKFVNQKGDTLHGILILPEQNAPSKIPIIIFLVGSANSAFDKNYRGFLKENLEDYLLEKGIGLCYFNKPGIGLSTGKWYSQSFQDRANDAKSCINYLKRLPSIDGDKMGIVGHSQGGWIAQMVASQFHKDIAFGISLSGPSYSVRRQLISDFASSLTCKGVEQSKAVRKAKRKTNFAFALAVVLPMNNNLRQLKRIRKYNPDNSIRDLSIPFLFIFGENDKLVYQDWCLQSLDEIFKQIFLQIFP